MSNNKPRYQRGVIALFLAAPPGLSGNYLDIFLARPHGTVLNSAVLVGDHDAVASVGTTICREGCQPTDMSIEGGHELPLSCRSHE